MKFAIHFACLFAVYAAFAEKQPIERYQSIIDRQMFGPLPPGFDPAKSPNDVQKSSSRNEEELTHYTLQYTINRAYANTRFLVAGLLIIVISMVAAIFTLGIGAIIVSYMYSMVPYLLHDYPELTPREAMKISREMMSGHKWNLFVLDLTFIGWILLAFCTAGVGMLFVQPYMLTARAAFYDDLRAEKLVEEADNTQETIEA
jgi:hypothetical protein